MTDKEVSARLVLASQSPVRARLLRNSGLVFRTVPAHVDEEALLASAGDAHPEEIAINLAAAKAKAVAGSLPEDLIVAADQLLVLEGAILKKPKDMDEARRRLMALSGRIHFLVTGAILARGTHVLMHHVETARLTMRALPVAEIDRHIALQGKKMLQSVGAYRLEGPDIGLFAAIEGDYFAILGLPLVPLLSALRRHAPHLLPGATPQ